LLAIGDRIQNWEAEDGQERPELESDSLGVLAKYQSNMCVYQYSCDKYGPGKTVKQEEQEY
jgi:hypothetical protein